jgi:hypothetical protein
MINWHRIVMDESHGPIEQQQSCPPVAYLVSAVPLVRHGIAYEG